MWVMRRANGAALALAIGLAFYPTGSDARQKTRASKRGAKAKAAQAKEKPAGQPQSELARLQAQFIEATKELKASLGRELELQEREVTRADERVTKTLELYRAGLVSKRDLEGDEAKAQEARAKAAVLEGRLKGADVQIAET